ncbi:MAG: hypothetical protein JO266_09975, partial [Acidobacteria bacterium]|nr:hypothetical protein [Acidobacteriota bacterium]
MIELAALTRHTFFVMDKISRRQVCSAPLCLAIALFLPASSLAIPKATPPGPISISVDATQVSQRILHARLVFPVNAGPLTLFYPKWMPADHSPDGPVWNLAGLKFHSATREIPWQQDPVDMYAFNVVVPPATTSL